MWVLQGPILFRGLRVRMCLASGTSTSCKVCICTLVNCNSIAASVSSISCSLDDAASAAVCLQVNPVTRAREYEGPTADLAKALSSCPHGGQILVDQATLDGVKPHLAELARTQRAQGSRQAWCAFALRRCLCCCVLCDAAPVPTLLAAAPRQGLLPPWVVHAPSSMPAASSI